MANREIVGHTSCPECDNPEAEARRAKNGWLYRYCPECGAQYFAKGPDADRRLSARTRFLADQIAPPADPVPAAKPTAKPVDPAPVPAAAPAPVVTRKTAPGLSLFGRGAS